MKNNKQATKIIAASLLGDGHVSKCGINKKGHNIQSGFRLTQTPEHKDHLEYIASQIEDVTTIRWVSRKPETDLIICGKHTQSKGYIGIQTQNIPFFTKFRERMYPNGHKVIDPHYLTLFDWEVLAIWYMQDGTRGSRCATVLRTPTFCSDNFSYGDHLLLRQVCIEKLNVIMNIRKHFSNGNLHYRLYVAAKSVEHFIHGISPYIQPSFEYKLNVYE